MPFGQFGGDSFFNFLKWEVENVKNIKEFNHIASWNEVYDYINKKTEK